MAISTRGASAMGAEHADRLARLDQQRLVGLEAAQRGDDAVEALPVARRAPDAAIDHQLARLLGDVGIEVVHQHAQRRLGEPALGRKRRAARRADRCGRCRCGSWQVLVTRRVRAGDRAPAASITAPLRTSRVAACMVGMHGAVLVEMRHLAAQQRAHRFERRAGRAAARWKSQPCAAASSSMPMTAPALSAMSISRRAPCAAIETWSSWLAEVGIESTLAG